MFFGSAGVFLALALFVYLQGPLPGERILYETVMAWASPGVTALFWWVNQLGNKWVLAPAALLLFWAAPAARRRWWLWAGVLLVAPVLEDLTKPLVGRFRPEGTAFGFPSGHVTAAAAFFLLVAYLGGKTAHRPAVRVLLWSAAGSVIALVGLARVVLRAHWPTDALGGAALGLACVSLAAWYHEASPPANHGRSATKR